VLRVREALDTGAEVIATACPYCIRMLNEAVRELGVGSQIVVRDLADLLLQSVAIRDEADTAAYIRRGVDQEVCHV
jgi:Fe-S oxidoreductase